MLDFKPVSMGIKPLVESYTFRYGEGSCQHSFVSSYCLRHKYGDMFCEQDNFLYTMRSKLCTEHERVYLFPHGDRNNQYALRQALQNVLDDAHENGSRVKFATLTESAKDIVMSLFPDKFEAEANRDYSEYVYKVDSLLRLPGVKFKAKRNCIHQFMRDYEGRYQICRIAPEHIEQVREFQAKWLEAKILGEDDYVHEHQLEGENESIQTALDDFFSLGLSGIVLFIDGVTAGFAYGSKLSENMFDTIAEKGDRNIRDVYLMVKQGLLTHCCADYEYMNYEEDIGVEGLRKMKMMFKPEYMLDKFIVTEK